MKILYLAFIRLPTEKAHGAQIMKTCEAFAGEGADVKLVIPGRKTPIQGDPFSYYEVKKNFIITSLKVPDLIGWGSIGFALSALWFSEKAKRRTSFLQADVIYSRDAFVLLQYILLGRKLVYEAHTKPTLISTFVAKRVFRLVVISEGLRDVYIKKGVKPVKIIVAHDAVDVGAFEKKYDRDDERSRLEIPKDKKIALYVGRISKEKGANTFAAASKHVSNGWMCVLIGPGSLQKKVLKEKYPKALFLPETPYRDLPRVLAAADVLVLPNSLEDEDASKYTSPMKAFAYLASKKIIVASDVPALKNILKDNATYFKADSPFGCACAIQEPDSKVIRDIEHLSWTHRAKLILKNINI